MSDLKTPDIEDFFKFQAPILGGKLVPLRGNQEAYSCLSGAQFRAEMAKCLACANAPCMVACPAGVNPKEFIYRAKHLQLSDIQRAVASIRRMNPMGWVCGVVCPDKFCMKACSRGKIDRPIDIPSIQATLFSLAYQYGVLPSFSISPSISPSQKVAIIGAGPCGLSIAAVLGSRGYKVHIMEESNVAGGVTRLIPSHRLPNAILDADIKHILSLGDIELFCNRKIDINDLSSEYDYVAISVGRSSHVSAGFSGEEYSIKAFDFLKDPSKFKLHSNVIIIGGGAVAIDCATTAKRMSSSVCIMYRRGLSEMPIDEFEKRELNSFNIDVFPRIIPIELKEDDTLMTSRVEMGHRSTGSTKTHLVPDSNAIWRNVSVIVAVGNKPYAFSEENIIKKMNNNVLFAGDVIYGSSTVVEAVAYGKNAGDYIDKVLSSKRNNIHFDSKFISTGTTISSSIIASEYDDSPMDISCDFFNKKLLSPFILSAGPLTDGINVCRRALNSGWAGVVMKTSFADQPIHIPNQYMDWMGDNTGFNADNVSDHPLSRVEKEIPILIKEYPNRLIAGSTGGPVTGNDVTDRKGWQGNTLRLERAGAMAVEYSLSCPQGGDGAEGDIVSQNGPLACKIIDWVMEISDAKIPKLFKLTGAVTSIQVIVSDIMKVFAKYPNKLCGITLANSFPSMVMRDLGDTNRLWEEGIIMGMSGSGVLPISLLTVSRAAPVGVTISGNGGVFSYMDAAHLMALGASSIQVCTLPEKDGLESYKDLCSGLSHLLKARNIKSVKELVGCAFPPVRDFMKLSAVKSISSVTPSECCSCGNCTRCPYNAIIMDANDHPVIDPSRCVGCQFCVLTCPTHALRMKKRI